LPQWDCFAVGYAARCREINFPISHPDIIRDSVMNIFYPVIPLKRLPAMLGIAAVGAIVAGIYGIFHDQMSYTISPEYFTKLKFRQFWYANFGWPQRVYASEVGFIASWWVGLIVGWVLARLGLDGIPWPERRGHVLRAFAIVFATAILIGAIGLALGTFVAHHSELSGWDDLRDDLGLHDVASFVIVAYLHGGSYLGALVGVIAAGIYVRKIVRGARLQRS
jgi:hypothetical protein